MKNSQKVGLVVMAALLATATGVCITSALDTKPAIARDTMTIDAENVVFVTPEVSDEPITIPEVRIVARKPVSDPLAGPGKRCAAGAWFSSRPLEQGSGNVRGFCP